MKKLLLLSLSLLLASTTLFAQQGRNYKPERRIYLWDVTGSMFFERNKLKDGTTLWDYVKEYIKNDISQISNENTEVYVIPFGVKVDTKLVWSAQANEQGKKEIIEAVDAYEYNEEYGGDTNLYAPLNYVKEHIISDDYVDVVYMLNDGEHDAHKLEAHKNSYNQYMSLLKEWCDISKAKDVYTYYIMLTDSAAKIKPYLPDCIVPIEGTHIPAFTRINFSSDALQLNVREDYGVDAKINWYLLAGSVPQGYKVRVVSNWNNVGNKFLEDIDSELLLNIGDDKSKEGVFHLPIEWRYDQSTTCNEAPRTDDNSQGVYIGSLVFEPAEGMAEGPYVGTNIMNGHNRVDVYMFNKSIKTINIKIKYEE